MESFALLYSPIKWRIEVRAVHVITVSIEKSLAQTWKQNRLSTWKRVWDSDICEYCLVRGYFPPHTHTCNYSQRTSLWRGKKILNVVGGFTYSSISSIEGNIPASSVLGKVTKIALIWLLPYNSYFTARFYTDIVTWDPSADNLDLRSSKVSSGFMSPSKSHFSGIKGIHEMGLLGFAQPVQTFCTYKPET